MPPTLLKHSEPRFFSDSNGNQRVIRSISRSKFVQRESQLCKRFTKCNDTFLSIYANVIHDLIESDQLFADLWSIVSKELHRVPSFSCFIIIHYQLTVRRYLTYSNDLSFHRSEREKGKYRGNSQRKRGINSQVRNSLFIIRKIGNDSIADV